MKEDSIKYILSKLSNPCEEDEKDAVTMIDKGWTPDQIIDFFIAWEYMTEEVK